jgi:hypothetical protein
MAQKNAMHEEGDFMRVRLRPYRPERGWNLRKFCDFGSNFTFAEGKWYKIYPRQRYGRFTGAEILDRLKAVCQNGDTRACNEAVGVVYDDAFDFARSEEQAKLIDKSYVSTQRRGRPMGTSRDPVALSPTIRNRPGRRVLASVVEDEDDIPEVLRSPPGDEPMELDAVGNETTTDAGPKESGKPGRGGKRQSS